MHEAPPLVTSAKPPIDGGPVKKKRKLGDDDEEASVPPPLPPTLIPANKVRLGQLEYLTLTFLIAHRQSYCHSQAGNSNSYNDL